MMSESAEFYMFPREVYIVKSEQDLVLMKLQGGTSPTPAQTTSAVELQVGICAFDGPKAILPAMVNNLPVRFPLAPIASAPADEITVPTMTVASSIAAAPPAIQKTLQARAPLAK